MNDQTNVGLARLMRAGSDYAKSKQKLTETGQRLISWLVDNIPCGISLPNGVTIDRVRAKVFIGEVDFHKNTPPSPERLKVLTALIASGWLDKVSELLEKEKEAIDTTVKAMEGFTQNEPNN